MQIVGQPDMPRDLQEVFLELAQWAKSTKSDAMRDAVAFWSLKGPAILASASAGLWAYFDLKVATVIMGAVASACVIIDGIHPRGMLRNIHLRAFHDIRVLIMNMANEWRSRSAGAKPDNVAKKIISNSGPERERIAKYVRDAETALRFKEGE
jgi:hypothetical protein